MPRSDHNDIMILLHHDVDATIQESESESDSLTGSDCSFGIVLLDIPLGLRSSFASIDTGNR